MPTLQYNSRRNLNCRLAYSLLIILALISAYFNYKLGRFFELFTFDQENDVEAINQLRYLNLTVSIMNIVQLTGFILFLVWLYRSYANALKFNNNNLSTSAAWSVGGFFVPIYSLYAGYKVTKEIWDIYNEKATDPKPEAAVQTTEIPTFSLPLQWWILYVLTGFISIYDDIRFDQYNVTESAPYFFRTVTFLIYVLYASAAVYMLTKFDQIEKRTFERHHQRDLMDHLTAE